MAGFGSHMFPDYTFDLARLNGELGQALTALERRDEALEKFDKGDRLFSGIAEAGS
jgi:hypothetical protein